MTKAKSKTIGRMCRLYIYKYLSYPMVFLISLFVSIALHQFGLMHPIIKHSSSLATTGATIAAFLFTMQGLLLAIPRDNPFIKKLRQQTEYLVYLHRFCVVAEIAFLVILLPMLYIDSNSVLVIILTAIYLSSIIFTLWAMVLLCKILIFCDKHSSD